MKRLWKICKLCANSVCGIASLVIVASISFQIFCRTFLGFSVSWSEEIAEICFVGMIFLYLAQCEENGAHLRLDILFQVFPRLKPYMDIAGKTLAIIYCAFVIWGECLLIPPTYKLTTAASHLPIRYIHYLIVIGSLFWIIQLCINIASIIRKQIAKENES